MRLDYAEFPVVSFHVKPENDLLILKNIIMKMESKVLVHILGIPIYSIVTIQHRLLPIRM